jgi:glycerol uptake facilitator protein
MIGEFVGTFFLILLGDGVVAGCILKRTKPEGAGWAAITTGGALLCSVAFLQQTYSGACLPWASP